MRELEAKDKVAQTRTDFSENVIGIQSNITFAQRLNLISEEQAQDMKRRVEIAVQQNQFMRNESEERIDDFENPRERAERYFKMDSVNAEINRERAAVEAGRVSRESTTSFKSMKSMPSADERGK